LGALNQVYNGTARHATAGTTPGGLTVDLSYDGDPNAPTNAGTYQVVGTINDLNYAGAATNTLTITKAIALVALGALNQAYDGTARHATADTTPGGLVVNLSYDGSPNAPTNAGSYAVIGTVVNANYSGAATNSLTIDQATLTATAVNKSRAYGRANPPFTISYAGFLNGDGVNNLNSTPTADTIATVTSPPGDYAIILTGGSDDNYAFDLFNGTLTITNAPLQITFATVTNGVAVITWTATAGQQYRLQFKDELTQPDWLDLSPDVPATGPTATFTNVVGNLSRRFYRVLGLP